MKEVVNLNENTADDILNQIAKEKGATKKKTLIKNYFRARFKEDYDSNGKDYKAYEKIFEKELNSQEYFAWVVKATENDIDGKKLADHLKDNMLGPWRTMKIIIDQCNNIKTQERHETEYWGSAKEYYSQMSKGLDRLIPKKTRENDNITANVKKKAPEKKAIKPVKKVEREKKAEPKIKMGDEKIDALLTKLDVLDPWWMATSSRSYGKLKTAMKRLKEFSDRNLTPEGIEGMEQDQITTYQARLRDVKKAAEDYFAHKKEDFDKDSNRRDSERSQVWEQPRIRAVFKVYEECLKRIEDAASYNKYSSHDDAELRVHTQYTTKGREILQERLFSIQTKIQHPEEYLIFDPNRRMRFNKEQKDYENKMAAKMKKAKTTGKDSTAVKTDGDNNKSLQSSGFGF